MMFDSMCVDHQTDGAGTKARHYALGDGTCEEHVQARSEGHDQAKTSAQVFKRDDAHRDNIQ